MAKETIIKGAIYKDGDELVRPHYSGQYWIVDCTEYKTKEDIFDNYDECDAINIIDSNEPMLYNDVEYYECEYSPHHTGSFELLSDISELEFYDYDTRF